MAGQALIDLARQVETSKDPSLAHTLIDRERAFLERVEDTKSKLLELAKKQPSQERQVYQQISEIKTEARKDDEAIEWAQKALAKNPTDPGAYERLGERYVEMQRFSDAIAAYAWDAEQVSALLLRLSAAMTDEVEHLAALEPSMQLDPASHG